MKKKTKALLVEALKAAIAAIVGVVSAALTGCTAVTTPDGTSKTIGVVGLGVPFGIQVNK